GSMRKGNYLDLFILAYEKTLLGFMLRRAKYIICSSDFVRMDFLKKYTSKSATITPGVDAEFFAPDPEIHKQDTNVLFVANLERGQEYKGLKTLLDAMKILKKEFPTIKLTVAGDGNLKSEYEAYAAKNDLKSDVIFRGRLEGRELLKAYQKADVFALPTSNDSQPLVILEAMAVGLPVVSTCIGGIPTMIENGKEGFLIKPNSPQILANKLAELLRNPQLRERFSEAARERVVEDFSWQKRMEKYNEILEKAMKRSE
ncbi:MAG: glycosyltransferase family 4 protein, partial [Candidatus Paceibacterota bacterium]